MTKEKKEVARFELLMDAGFGAQKAGDILIRSLATTGRYVYIEPMIPAEISPPPRTRPALSGVIVRLGEFDLTNIGNNTDIILASHEIVLDRRLDDEEHNSECRVLLDMSDKKANEDSYEQVCKRVTKLGLTIYPFEICEEAKLLIRSLLGKGKNIYYLGMLSAIYNIAEETVINQIRSTFGKKLKEDILQKNIQLFHYGHKYATEHIEFSYEVSGSKNNNGERILIDGNSALSMGLIDAGVKLYSGYPITPASSIMHTLAKELPAYGGAVHQAEDEISAIGTAIGSYFGGVPAATGTSGPGLSLKQEFIGWASAAEAPVIILDIQRSGPSTGMPTKTEQSDLPAIVFGSHGDNTKIVISVCNVLDCFYAPQLARYLTEKLCLPVFIVSDFLTANSYKVISKPAVTMMENVEDISDFVFERFGINRLPDDIEMIRLDQSTPGTPDGMRRITGLNTDESGSVNYFSVANQRSHAVRNEKVHHVRRALKEPEMFGKVKNGKVLIVGWGSTRGPLEEAVLSCQEQGLSVGGMCLKVVYPLPLMLKDIFSKFEYVATVELGYGDPLKKPPLAMLLRSQTLSDVQSIVCRATGRPIPPNLIESKIKEVLSGRQV